jgi:ATP-dependent DNA ligase
MALAYPVPVMVARAVSSLPAGDGYAYEPKFDGFRCVAFRTDKPQARLQSRNERSLTDRFLDVAQAVADHVPEGTVLDGELVVVAGGKLDFAALQQRMASNSAKLPACLVVFDMLADRGVDVRGLPYLERRGRLEQLVGTGNAGVNLMPMTRELSGAQAWLNDHRAAGIEGVVAKRVDQKYLPGRHHWSKVRSRSTTEAIVGGVTGSLSEPTGLILGRPDEHGRLRVVGRSFPLPRAVRSELASLIVPADRSHPWPTVLPAGRFGLGGGDPVEYVPVAPELVVELEVDVAYEHHRWRHGARFVRTRRDLDPADIQQILGP